MIRSTLKNRIVSLQQEWSSLFRFVLLLGLLCGWFWHSSTQLGYHWQWYRLPRYLFSFDGGVFFPGPLLEGLSITLQIVALSLPLAFLIGLVTALLRLSGAPLATLVARFYLETIRNTPLLIQIFLLYFVFAPVFDLSRFSSAVLALSLFEGAYASEIIRAGILGIAPGQWSAAASLGLTRWQSYRLVILPQGLRQMLPPLTSQAVSLVKDSALVSTIAIYDLTMQGQMIVAETFLTFEIWFTIAAIYLALTLSLSLLVRQLEFRLEMPH